MWKLSNSFNKQLATTFLKAQKYPSKQQLYYSQLYQRQYFSNKSKQNNTQQTNQDNKYSYWEDERLKKLAQNLILFVAIVYSSGKLTKFLINRYLLDEHTQISEDKQVGHKMQQELSQKDIYKKPSVISDEFYNTPILNNQQLKNKHFFGKERNYFVQIVQEDQELKLDNKMHPHYYILKTLTRKKSQPLYPYRLSASEFKDDDKNLRKTLNMSYEELKDIDYVLVNENSMKLPVEKNGPSAISYKFVMNPQKIKDLDELYDALDVNSGTNTKYLVICNPNQSAQKMNIQQKMFRKFFYENSSFFDNHIVFLEITNERIAKRIGIEQQDQIFVFQNQNQFSQLVGAEDTKLLNLPLQKLQCDSLRQKQLEKKYVKYLRDFTKREFEDMLMNDEFIDETFSQLAQFIEEIMVTKQDIIYVPTTRLLKFYKNHFRNRYQELLFIQTDQKNLQSTIQQVKSLQNNKIPVLISDIKHSSQVFNLLCNQDYPCIRYINYGQLYNEKTKQVLKIEDMLNNEQIRQQNQKFTDNLFVLKFKNQSNQSIQEFINQVQNNQLSPYLENDELISNQLDGIQTISKHNYEQYLKNKDYTIIEVIAQKCNACKQVDLVMGELKNKLVDKRIQICRMNIFNEVSFMKDCDQTPTFIIYNKKKQSFTKVNMKEEGEEQQVDMNDNQQLVEYLENKIRKQIKEQMK